MAENDMINPVGGNLPAVPTEPARAPEPAPDPPPPPPQQAEPPPPPPQYPETLTGRIINEIV
jgi:hypothetical protein